MNGNASVKKRVYFVLLLFIILFGCGLPKLLTNIESQREDLGTDGK